MKIVIRQFSSSCIPIVLISSFASAFQVAPTTQTQPPTQQVQINDSSPQAERGAKKSRKSEIKKEERTGTSDDRLFYALPNFLTVESKNVPPLTASQKFKVVARGSFDYIQVPWYGFLAGIGQAEDSEAGYGQGAAGYGKRFGAYAADGTIENFFTGAILPSMFHEDPRYFQSGEGGFWRRTRYSVSRIFVTRTDSGGHHFNFSEIVGSALSAGISTYSYHPKGDRTVPNTASVWGTQVGYDTFTIVVKEFWPDIRRKLSKTK
ncbi:MAG: hypothetical protein NVS1B11_08720 [Terriglobales bacterium]